MPVEPIEVELVPEDDDFKQSIKEAERELDEITDKAKIAQAEAKKAQQEQAKIGKEQRPRVSQWSGTKGSTGRTQQNKDFLNFQSPMAKLIGNSGKALVVIHGIGQALRAGAAIRTSLTELERVAPDATIGEKARTGGGLAAETGFRAVASVTGLGEISSSIAELALGKEGAERASKRFFDQMFKTQEALKREQDERERAIEQSLREMNASVAESFGQLDSQLPTTFRFRHSRDLRQYRRIIKNRNRAFHELQLEANEQKAKGAGLFKNEGF